MGLFSKDGSCDGCGAVLSRKQLHQFDPTWHRERWSDDARRRLCTVCLSRALGEYFRAFDHRALAVAPVFEGQAYSFAPLDLRTPFLWSDELQDTVRDLLPPRDVGCRRCGEIARFNWCGLEIFQKGPDELRLKPRGTFGEELLCGSCAAAEFERLIQGTSKAFQEVLPPADGDGVMAPASC